jgi:hypothetical protein
VEVLEVSLQGGNARLPTFLITSLCCSIIVLIVVVLALVMP